MAAPTKTNNFEDLIDTHFKKGAEVEISSNDDGFRGSWYAGTVIRPIKRSKNSTNSKAAAAAATGRTNNKVLVEYKTLTADDSGRRPLREELDVVQLRPPPPREGVRSFKFSEEVDAYYNDGWWEGVITEVLENGRYSVFFRGTRDQLDFGREQLRLHREWLNGKWVPPLEKSPQDEAEKEQETEAKTSIETIEEKFSPGKPVEVSSDEEGFRGAWFAATVVKKLDNGKYLIEYKCLRNDDDTEFLKEEVDSQHIRPYPPDTNRVDRFKVSDVVDALYNDGWWVGVISKVLSRQRYIVYFRETKEKLEFKYSDLRPRQDWIDGKWVIPSKALKL